LFLLLKLKDILKEINMETVFLQAGKLNTYRFCDNVWTFMLNDVEFREAQEMAKVDKVKIVACDGKSEFAASFTIRMRVV
jgi:predicted HAD superfamily hydrolase